MESHAERACKQMERHRGHLLNWYDTETLQPLLPRFTCPRSTVATSACTCLPWPRRVACSRGAASRHRRPPRRRMQRSAGASCSPALQQQPRTGMRNDAAHARCTETACWGRCCRPDAARSARCCGQRGVSRGLLDAAAQDDSAQRAPSAPRPRTGRDAAQPGRQGRSRPRQPCTPCWATTWRHCSSVGPWTSKQPRPKVAAPRDHAPAASIPGQAALDAARVGSPSFGFLYHPKRHLLHIGFRLDDQALGRFVLRPAGLRVAQHQPAGHRQGRCAHEALGRAGSSAVCPAGAMRCCARGRVRCSSTSCPRCSWPSRMAVCCARRDCSALMRADRARCTAGQRYAVGHFGKRLRRSRPHAGLPVRAAGRAAAWRLRRTPLG